MRTVSVLFVALLATGSPDGLLAQRPATTGTAAPLLRYDQIGSGPPLLLLHGFGGCAWTWGPFDSTLATRYQLIIPDLPGHGGSPRPAGVYTSRNAAQEVIRLLDSLKLPSVRAIGISAGGMALLHAMIERPDLFDRVIIVGAAGTIPPPARMILHHTTSLDSVPEPVRGLWRRCAEDRQEQLDWLVRQFHGIGDNYTDMNLGPRDLARIKARLLIVHGDRDAFFPADIPTAIHLAVPTSALWIVPFGDHVPIMGRWKGRFLEEATAFFDAP